MYTPFANSYDHCPLILQVSTFILLKVLRNEVGLRHCCDTRGPFYDIAFALQKRVNSPDERPSARLLKCIIRCYLRLFDHRRFVPAVIPVVVISFHALYLSSSANVVSFFSPMHAGVVRCLKQVFPACYEMGHSMATSW